MNVSKAVRLLSLLPAHPVEFYDRVATVVQVTSEAHEKSGGPTAGVSYPDALTRALSVPTSCILEVLAEKQLRQIEQNVLAAMTNANRESPFDAGHNGDFSLARSIYVICRLLRPNVVLETGVAHGVTSAFALQALAINQTGILFSIDLPPLGAEADKHVGAFVAPELRGRWRLNRGPTKRVLPKLLPTIKEVDLFVHDSLHTYRNMDFEFRTVWPYLRPGGFLISDDVGLNDAFEDFSSQVGPVISALINQEDKNALFGILVKAA